jgi:GST-like protein
MIEVFYCPTPNGHKITMFLEEAGVPYHLTPVDITKGEQFTPAFLAVSPNNRIPAIVDHAPADGGAPISVFESGAILLYLTEKTGRFLPADSRARITCSEWLFWQVGNLGPVAGENHHLTCTHRKTAVRHRAVPARDCAPVRSARRAPASEVHLRQQYTIADMATIRGSCRTSASSRTWTISAGQALVRAIRAVPARSAPAQGEQFRRPTEISDDAQGLVRAGSPPDLSRPLRLALAICPRRRP